MSVLKRIRHIKDDWNAGVAHATFDPKGQGVARLFLIPPKPSLKERDWLLVINSQMVLTVSRSWAVLLRTFFQQLSEDAVVGKEIDESMMSTIVFRTVLKMRAQYPEIELERFRNDLNEMVSIILAIARGQEVPPEVFQGQTLLEYAPNLRAPLRMDLMVSPMRNSGKWACPLHCGACYAEDQPLMDTEPMDYAHWIQTIRVLGRIGIPELTFTGGESLANKHIVSLVEFAQWHLTRLNTNGVLLTPELAAKLYAANLDAIQITLYSERTTVHDQLVGQVNAWGRTVTGIKDAVAAGLLTSINTPLLRANRDYDATLRYIKTLGVRYVTCSGLIPTGGALKQVVMGETLTQVELYETLARALEVASELGMELNFTSPGALTNEQLSRLGLQVPVCGACLDNMAITPAGQVVPCQSALQNSDDLGHIIFDDWKRIWDNRRCRQMRKTSAGKNACPLGGAR